MATLFIGNVLQGKGGEVIGLMPNASENNPIDCENSLFFRPAPLCPPIIFRFWTPNDERNSSHGGIKQDNPQGIFSLDPLVVWNNRIKITNEKMYVPIMP